MLPTMAGLYLSWATFRAAHPNATTARDLPAIAEDLAGAVEAQWRDEVQVRRLNDPYPLPVSWLPAQPDLVEEWPLVIETAKEWPGGPPGQSTDWAHDPADLAAQWAEIVEVFCERIPTRRLVVLGDPGSGKTMLLVRLAQGLLANRATRTDLAVPVIFSLASWNPLEEGLFTWMEACLSRDYLGLGQAAPIPHGDVSRAAALLAQKMILPILDGFDEMPFELRPVALDVINQSLPPGQGLVLSSRTQEFREVLEAPGIVSVKLAGAVGIELQTLDGMVAGAYLLRDAGSTVNAERRWKPVIDKLGTSSPVGMALRTPLMLFLTRTIYNPRPGDGRGTVFADPAILCDDDRFTDQQAVEKHLLSSYVPACYRPLSPGDRIARDADSAERALTFLAQHLEGPLSGSPDLAWWQLTRSVPRRLSSVLVWLLVVSGVFVPIAGLGGLISGLAYGLVKMGTGGTSASLEFGLIAGVTGGMTGGLVFGIFTSIMAIARKSSRAPGGAWLGGRPPVNRVRLTWDGSFIALVLGLTLFCGIVAHALFSSSIVLLVSAPLLVALLVWGSLHADPMDVTRAGGPNALLHQERRSILMGALILAPLSACSVSVAFALWGGFSPDPAKALAVGLAVGAGIGLVMGTVTRFSQLAWLSFTAARWYFAMRSELPRDLMAFLQDAHQRRGVLRQIAGVYQFRHLDLQRSLAGKSPTGVSATGGGNP